ncbi:hypothetical protein ACWGDE_24780 [Streptomyces sp. NPDC054956]
MKDMIAFPLFYLAAWAPEVVSAVLGVGLVVGLGHQDMPLPAGLTLLALALIGALAIHLAVGLPLLRMSTGGHRTIQDACNEAAEAVADWAGWDAPDDNP